MLLFYDLRSAAASIGLCQGSSEGRTDGAPRTRPRHGGAWRPLADGNGRDRGGSAAGAGAGARRRPARTQNGSQACSRLRRGFGFTLAASRPSFHLQRDFVSWTSICGSLGLFFGSCSEGSELWLALFPGPKRATPVGTSQRAALLILADLPARARRPNGRPASGARSPPGRIYIPGASPGFDAAYLRTLRVYLVAAADHTRPSFVLVRSHAPRTMAAPSKTREPSTHDPRAI